MAQCEDGAMSPISWPVWELTDTSIQPQLRAWNEPHRIPAQWDSGRAGKFGKIVKIVVYGT